MSPSTEFQGRSDRKVKISQRKIEEGEDGFVMASNCGKIQLSLAFYSQHGTLKVGIVRCQSLSGADPQKDSADPFVRVQANTLGGRALSESLQCPFRVLLPESTSDCRKKTTIKWDSFNPEFNEQVKEMNHFPQ